MADICRFVLLSSYSRCCCSSSQRETPPRTNDECWAQCIFSRSSSSQRAFVCFSWGLGLLAARCCWPLALRVRPTAACLVAGSGSSSLSYIYCTCCVCKENSFEYPLKSAEQRPLRSYFRVGRFLKYPLLCVPPPTTPPHLLLLLVWDVTTMPRDSLSFSILTIHTVVAPLPLPGCVFSFNLDNRLGRPAAKD